MSVTSYKFHPSSTHKGLLKYIGCFWTLRASRMFARDPWVHLEVCFFSKFNSIIVQFSSVAQLCPTLCDPMYCSTPGLPVWLPTPRVYSNSCSLSRWCHPTVLSSVIPFSFCLQSFPALRSFPLSQFFISGGQNTGVSTLASVLPMNIQDWFPLGWTG